MPRHTTVSDGPGRLWRRAALDDPLSRYAQRLRTARIRLRRASRAVAPKRADLPSLSSDGSDGFNSFP